MSHIPNDKRAQKSADLIFQALVRSLRTKKISDISSRDIQELSGVSRATYYRLFGNNVDVLKYGCGKLSEMIISDCPEFPSDENTLEKFSLYVIKSWMDNYQVLEALIQCGRSELLLDCLRMNADRIKNINQLYDFGEATLEYFTNMVFSLLHGTLLTWVQRGRKETAEEITSIFMNLTGRCFKESLVGRA